MDGFRARIRLSANKDGTAGAASTFRFRRLINPPRSKLCFIQRHQDVLRSSTVLVTMPESKSHLPLTTLLT